MVKDGHANNIVINNIIIFCYFYCFYFVIIKKLPIIIIKFKKNGLFLNYGQRLTYQLIML